MKKLLIAGTTLGVLAGSLQADTSSTSADTSSTSNYSGSVDGTPKFEAGAIFGEPTGVSLKYWLNDTMALDGGVGWSFRDDDDLHLHSDILWHNFEVFNVSEGRLPLYYGVGVRAKFRDNRDDLVGIRVPIGISYLFEKAPISLFLEVAPVLDLTPDTDADFTAGIGVRFCF